MRHYGSHVGNFYLVKEVGSGAFADGDEGILALFASRGWWRPMAGASAPRAAWS